MRQIDADGLKDNMFRYAAPEMVWDRGDIEHKINEMPTIDAIPLEWLKTQLIDEFYDELIFRWQKEQEAQGG